MQKRSVRDWVFFRRPGLSARRNGGAGTLVCIALVGPVAGLFLPVNEKMVRRILKGVTAAHDD